MTDSQAFNLNWETRLIKPIYLIRSWSRFETNFLFIDNTNKLKSKSWNIKFKRRRYKMTLM